MMGKITKSTIAAGFASIVLLLSGCPLLPPPNNAPTLDPKQTSITINEAQNLFLEGKVSDDNSSLDQILFEVSSDRFAFSSVEKTLPDNFSIEGSPKDKNYYGSTHMEISATDHNGARITFRIPITVKDTPDLVVTDWPTSIEVDKGQTFQITFKLTDDYSDWNNGITKSFVCDKYNIVFEAISATDGRLTFTPKDPGYVGTTGLEMTVSDDEGNTTNKTLEIVVNDVVNPNNPPQITGPASLSIDEGLQAVVDFTVTDDKTEFAELLIEAMSTQYNVSLERIAPNTVRVTGIPKDRNYYGNAGMTVKATDLEGSLATYALPITVKDTPDLVVTDWPTSIEVGKGQTFQITFKLTDDYSDWYNGIAKSFVCDKYNIAFEAINATDGRLTFTPKDPTYVGTTDFGMTVSDDEGNTTNKTLEIIVNDVVNPNNPPQITGPASLSIDEGLQAVVDFTVTDDKTEFAELLIEAMSTQYNVSLERIAPNTVRVTGIPKDRNYYGNAGMTVKATDLEGSLATYALPITVKDTPDLVVTDWPTSIEVDKGQTFQITFKLTDDYSDWYNGIAKSFVCDKYNIAFEAINATDGRLTFTPKDPGYVGTTDFGMTISDDEGNTVDRSLEIIVNDVANSKPTIEIPDFTIKEGENKDVTVKIIDEDPLPNLDVAISSEQYNVSCQKVNDTDLLITFTRLDDDKHGPANFTVQATDTQNLGEKVTKTFQVTPMTDLELKILGQTLNVSGGIIVGSQLSNQSNVSVKVYQRDVNWMEKEEYGDLYHYRIGIDSALGELLFQGTTNSQGSIKFQVDPKAYDEALLYVVLGKSGFLDKTRHFFGDTDLGSTSLILSQDNPLINEWLYYSLCNNGYQPLDGTAYIPKSNVTWPHLVFPNYPRPDVAIIIPEGEYVSQEVLDAIPEAVEHVFGPGMNIFQTSDKGEIKDNRIAIMFTDVGGSGWVSKYALSNLIGSAGIYVRREFVDNNYTVYEIIHELGHDLFCNAHKENMDSHYSNLGYDFSTYPYFTGADKAVQQLVLAVGNMLPGDKYVYEGSSLKQLSFSVLKGDKVYYLQYE